MKLYLVLALAFILAGSFKGVQCDTEVCQVKTDGNLCLYNGKKILAESAHIDANVLFLSFDSENLMDSSGYEQNIVTQPEDYTPGLYGIGSSAKLDKDNYIEVEDADEFGETEYTISFWILYNGGVESDGTGYMFCPLVLKGNDDYSEEEHTRGPGIFVERETGNLVVYWDSEDAGTYPMGEYVVSTGAIGIKRWSHVAFVRESGRGSLYINGVLDAFNETDSSTIPNDYNLFIGTPPSYSSMCNIEWYVDNFKYFDRAVPSEIILADAYSSIGSMLTTEVVIGCQSCGYTDAIEVCENDDEYHLCNTFEVNSYAFSYGKSMGWIDYDTLIWSENENADYETFIEVLENTRYTDTVALCCLNH